MKIDILCDSHNHPVLPYLSDWSKNTEKFGHEVHLINKKDDAKGGDILFLISCGQIIDSKIRDLYIRTLVIHASDLPRGRGWSPLVWQILEGKDEITVSLLDAKDPVDSGGVYKKHIMKFEGTELFDEINRELFNATKDLMTWSVENCDNMHPEIQDESNATYYKKRSPDDSELDIDKPLKDHINTLRICDPDRYPAFFYYQGVKYNIKINKAQ